jgi:dihydroflavonol-4-reductase
MNERRENVLVLVTGASGYLGGHVTREFLEHGYRVRGTVRSLANPSKVDHLRSLGAAHGDRLELVEADLTRDAGWKEAVSGCTFVEHVASPFPAAEPDDENELLRPAIDGTLRVLGAAADSASVRRVVLTSSVAAVASGHAPSPGRIFTEEDWSLVDACQAYPKSKTLAERAAWDFVAGLPKQRNLELATVNPGFIAGPLLGPDIGTSGEVVGRMMRRELPACPRLGWSIVDVRDVAIAHRLATEKPEAAGQRFIAAGGHLWMQDIGRILADEFGPRGYRPPTGHLPYPLLWLASRFDKGLRLVLPSIGRTESVSHDKAQRLLGWSPRPPRETFVEMAESMIARGLIPSR